MVKNSGAALLVACTASAFLSACENARAVPPGYQGVVELDERRLGFELPGRLKEVPVVRGQLVEPGQTLALLDDGLERPVRAARAADAQLRAAQAALAKVDTNLARARKLLAEGAVNQSEVDNLEQDQRRAAEEARAQAERVRLLRAGSRPEDLAAAEARAAAAAAAVDAEDEKLRRFVLHADAPLAILDVHLKAGEIAAAGAPVLSVADPAHPYVDVFVPVADLPGVKIGRGAALRVDGEPGVFSGKVEDVGRETEFTPRYLFSPKERPHLVVRVRVRVEDPGRRLHAGIPGFVTWN